MEESGVDACERGGRGKGEKERDFVCVKRLSYELMTGKPSENKNVCERMLVGGLFLRETWPET